MTEEAPMSDIPPADTVDDDIESDARWGGRPDTVRFLTGGRVFLRAGGVEYLLAAPTMASCRLLSDTNRDAVKGQAKIQADLVALSQELSAIDSDDKGAIDAMTARLDTQADEMRDEVETWQAQTAEAMRIVVEASALGDKVLPAAEYLPAWFGNPDFLAAVLDHWRTTPLVPGRS